VVFVNSFTISQKDMFESVLRVTDTEPKDWNIAKESTTERWASGMKAIQEGNRTGFFKLVARLFYSDGCGDFEHSKGTLNGLLQLPKEELDDATRLAIERAKTGA
jgi:hypothetical protein